MKISAIYGNVNLLAMEEKTMSMFNHEARQFKFDVLKEISQLAYEGKLTDDSAAAISRKLIPGRKAEFRCCVYKEREILRQRTRLACGKMADEAAAYNPRQIVQVIDAACEIGRAHV